MTSCTSEVTLKVRFRTPQTESRQEVETDSPPAMDTESRQEVGTESPPAAEAESHHKEVETGIPLGPEHGSLEWLENRQAELRTTLKVR